MTAAQKKIAATLLLAAVALLSFLWLSKVTASPEFYAPSMQALDEKKVTAMEMTAAAATTSVAVAAIPGDATTPIAQEIASLSSYLMVVVGAILLEKFLLTATGWLAFKCLIPIACVLGIVVLYLPWETLRRTIGHLAWRLAVFGLAIFLLIPASVKLSGLVEETFHTQQTVDAALETSEVQPEEAPQEEGNGVSKWFSQIGEQITGAASDAADAAKNALNRFIDAIAVLLITTCAIPLLVLFAFIWLAKTILYIPLEPRLPKLPGAGVPHAPKHGGKQEESQE